MLPPNARAIKKARDVGQHPSQINIVYSRTWCASQYPKGCVMVLSGEYTAGEYSAFSWCSGVPTVLVNHDRPWMEFARLVADVAQWTAPTMVEGIDDGQVGADYFFYALRWLAPGQVWPPMWNDAKARAYAQRDSRADYIRQRRAMA